MTPWPAFGTALLIGPLLFACGQISGDQPSDAGEPAHSTSNSDPQFDPAFDVAAEYAKACDLACVAAEPESTAAGGWPCPVAGTVEGCVEQCGAGLTNVDRGCADCLVAHLVWIAPSAYCSASECLCNSGPGPRLPALTDTLCRDACSSSLEYQLALRLDAPAPTDLGRVPDRVVELPGFHLTQLAASRDSDTFVAAGHHRDVQVVGLWNFDGQPEWMIELEASNLSMAQVDKGQVAVEFRAPTEQWIWLLDEQGELVAQCQRPLQGEVLRSAPGGRLLAVGTNEIVSFDRDLEIESSWTAPSGLEGAPPVILDDASLVVGAYGSVFRFVLDQGTFREDWVREFGGQVTALLDAGDQGIVAAGAGVSPAGAEAGTYARQYLLRRFSPEGGLLSTLEPAGSGVVGYVTAALRNGEGNVVIVGREDPVSGGAAGARRYTPAPGSIDEYAGECSVYGCESLFVRELSLAGDTSWFYQRRRESGYATDAIVLSDGTLRVLAAVRREEESTIVLDFAPR